MAGRRATATVILATAFAPLSLAAQITGTPVINNPHTPAGPMLHGLVAFPNARGGGGYGVTGGFQYGVGRFAFGVMLGARNPGRDLSFPRALAESVEGYAVYGATAALRLAGSPTSLFAAGVQLAAGFEDRHRVAGSEVVLKSPSQKTFVGTVGAGARVAVGGIALEPWAAVGPRLVVHDVGNYPLCLGCFVTLGASDRIVERRDIDIRAGASGGVDVHVSQVIGLRLALGLVETTVPLVLTQTSGGIVFIDAESSSLQTTPLLVAAGLMIRFPR
jgi:hypothetical protein